MESVTTMQAVWENMLHTMEGRMSERNFDLWIRPLGYVSFTGDTLTLSAPNSYLKEWFEDNYQDAMQRDLTREIGCAISIQIRIDHNSAGEVPMAGEIPDPPFSEISPPSASSIHRSNLNDRYRFESFVVGPSNQFARAASELVAESPGTRYNPLFIYGGTGLGKTHLLQAIGHALLDRHPGWRVLYVTSERFMNEYITNVRQKRMEEFRDRYRQNCDVLLVDDIQFFANKENTQQEFFHTFNALHERQKQIVITSDRFPNQLPELEDRLKSRFQWGLIVDILVPEMDTRVAILKKKAEIDHISLPDDVAHFIAQHIKSNVRELEGALIRLAAFSSLQGRTITVEFAEKVLGNMIQRGRGQVSIDRIQREVASYFNIRQKDLKGSRRPRAISYPRQIAMYLSRCLTGASLSEIGRQFGGKDHTTVLSADKKIRRLLEEEDDTRLAVESLERLLSS